MGDRISELDELAETPNILDYIAIVDESESPDKTKRITIANLHGGLDITAITFIIDGGGSEITTGIHGDIPIPFDCTIQEVTMLADQSGSIVIDIWKQVYGSYPPTNSESITASAVPTITTAVKSQDATLTGWTTAISAGDTLRYNVDSVTTIQRVVISLKVRKT